MAERWTRQGASSTLAMCCWTPPGKCLPSAGSAARLWKTSRRPPAIPAAHLLAFRHQRRTFLAVIERHLLRFLNGFEDIIGAFESLADLDVAQFAERWRELTIAGSDSAALGYEFSLFLLRNPGARERLAAKREETIQSLADYISTNIARLGGTLTIPADALARVLIASHDAVTINAHLDGKDLYEPFLQMVMSNVAPKPAAVKRRRARRTG